jgi:hypothetical protein
MLACGATMTRTEIETNGRKVLTGSQDQVFAACIDGLKAQGFQIALAKPEKGLIKTERRSIVGNTQGSVDASGRVNAYTVVYYRQWTLNVESVGENKVQVTAEPRISQGDMDISDRKIWSLKGEYKLWTALFTAINEAL